MARNCSQDSPETETAGRTSASTPPGLSLAWARSTKFEASPAFPSPALNPSILLVSRLRAADILFCVAASVPIPANAGFGMSPWAPSWLVGLVKGGFMIARSRDASSITAVVCTSCPLAAVTMEPSPNSAGSSSVCNRSRVPSLTTGLPPPTSGTSPYFMTHVRVQV